MGISLEQAQNHLDSWLEADAAVAQGQEYRIDGMSLTRADAGAITDKINYWRRMVSRLQRARTGMRITRIVPRDV